MKQNIEFLDNNQDLRDKLRLAIVNNSKKGYHLDKTEITGSFLIAYFEKEEEMIITGTPVNTYSEIH